MTVKLFKNILGKPNMMSAPIFAYYTLYGKKPKVALLGGFEKHLSKTINDILINKGIPTEAIKELISIKGIKYEMSSQGTNESYPTFFIFKLSKSSEFAAKKMVDNLNQMENIKSSYNINNDNKYRICITYNTWFKESDFDEWWLSLPVKIKNSL